MSFGAVRAPLGGAKLQAKQHGFAATAMVRSRRHSQQNPVGRSERVCAWNVSEGHNLWPWDLRIPALQLFGDPRRFSDDRQFLHNGALDQLRFQESFKMRFSKERGNVAGSLDDVMTVKSSRRIDEPRVGEHGRPDARFQSV